MKQICKECIIEKDYSEFYKYKHTPKPSWRCKECIKAWRKSERERVMARVIDNNRTRPEWYVYNRTVEDRRKNPIKNKARAIVNRYFRYHKEDKPTVCSNCDIEWRIELHHFDYTKPREVIPLCSLCHSHIHIWKINLNLEAVITF